MGETVRDFRRQRARAVRRFGLDGKDYGLDKIQRRGRKRNISSQLDFQNAFSLNGRARQCFADVCNLLHFILAFPDVAFISKENPYKNLD